MEDIVFESKLPFAEPEVVVLGEVEELTTMGGIIFTDMGPHEHLL